MAFILKKNQAKSMDQAGLGRVKPIPFGPVPSRTGHPVSSPRLELMHPYVNRESIGIVGNSQEFPVIPFNSGRESVSEIPSYPGVGQNSGSTQF
jgi:hypothetical protein